MGGKNVNRPKWSSKITPETEQIVQLLRPHFVKHPANYPPAAYRYNSASIRVRVVDEIFRKKNLVERDKLVAPILEKNLPEETYSDIMILLLLAPEEIDESPANFEFEHPRPTRL